MGMRSCGRGEGAGRPSVRPGRPGPARGHSWRSDLSPSHGRCPDRNGRTSSFAPLSGGARSNRPRCVPAEDDMARTAGLVSWIAIMRGSTIRSALRPTACAIGVVVDTVGGQNLPRARRSSAAKSKTLRDRALYTAGFTLYMVTIIEIYSVKLPLKPKTG